MTMDLTRLTFILLAASGSRYGVASGEIQTLNNGTAAGPMEISNQTTPHSYPQSAVTLPTVADENRTKEKASTKPLQQRRETTQINMPILKTVTTATPNSSMSQSSKTTSMGSTEEVQSAVMITNQTSLPPKSASMSLPLSNSTQTQSIGTTISSTQVSRDERTHQTAFSPQSKNPTRTTPTSTTPEGKPESTRQSTSVSVKQSTDLHKTSMSVHTTKASKISVPSGKIEDSKKGTNHGKIVAGLIGGALSLMMVGFLVIYFKKRKLQKKQITAADWAGPSPFLDGGADDGQVTSNRISLASFLPQRLSKRLSLLPETDEELEDMTTATTFGNKSQGTTFGQEVDKNDGKESNGAAAVVPEVKSTEETGKTEETAETVENSV